MGMNVNLGTGVNSYAQKALPTTAPGYTSKVQSSLLSQPDYDTVSFSGNYQTQEKKEGMSTGAKVGLVAAAATLIVGAVAASRGKKINGEASKGLVNNITTGLKSIFTKAGRESYKKLANKADDVIQASTEAGKKAATTQKGATKFTQETMEKAGENARNAQKEIETLNKKIAKLDPNSKTYKEELAKLENQIKKQEGVIAKFNNLTVSENLASDKTYTKLKDTKSKAREALDAATKKKEGYEASKKALEKQKSDLLTEIGHKKQTPEQADKLKSLNEQIQKKETQIQNIVNGTKDKNGKVSTKPLSELKAEHTKALEATKQYKQATKTLSEAQIAANNNTQAYKQLLEKKNATLTPTQGLTDKVNTLKTQADTSNSTLEKLKKAWEEFAKTGKYDEKIFGKI